MKRYVFVLVLVVGLAALGLAQPAGDLPTVDQILAKSVQADGGKAATEKLTSRVLKGTIEVPTFNASGNIEMYAKAPDKQLSRSEFEGYGEVLQGYDGKSGWAKTPDGGLRELSGVELDRVKRGADFYRGLHLKDQYAKMTVTGKGKAGEREAYIIEAQPAQGGPEKFYFDAQTGLMLRVELAAPQGGQATIIFEDYKEVDGVKLPHTIRQDSPEMSWVIKVAQAQHNVAIDDAKFAKPAN